MFSPYHDISGFSITFIRYSVSHLISSLVVSVSQAIAIITSGGRSVVDVDAAVVVVVVGGVVVVVVGGRVVLVVVLDSVVVALWSSVNLHMRSH